MKKIFFFALISLSISLNGQQQMEGMVQYLITHSWTKKMQAVPYISKQRKERLTYMWGGRDEWKSYANLYFNTKESKYIDSEVTPAGEEDYNYAWRKDVYLIKRDYEKQAQFDAIQMLGKVYIIEDSLQLLDWKIQNDLKDIAGHICMKAFAEDTLKKQKIVAWFAQDIPLSYGPERFGGLPGLIMEIDVNDGGMIITADKIDYKKLTTEMDLPKKLKGKKIKEKEYSDMMRKFMVEREKAEEPPFWGIRY
jgi:GLPGLI family protein